MKNLFKVSGLTLLLILLVPIFTSAEEYLEEKTGEINQNEDGVSLIEWDNKTSIGVDRADYNSF